MTKEERFELIEAYLLRKMDSIQQREFEHLLDQDPGLQEELTLHQGLHEAIVNKKLGYFEQLIEESAEKYFESPTQARQISLATAWGLAVAACLLMLGLSYLFFRPKASTQDLFTQTFEPYQAPAVFRSGEAVDIDQDLLLGMAAYDQENYAEALPHFQTFLLHTPNQDLAIFLQGLSYLALDSLPQAKKDLHLLLDEPEGLFYAQAQWYLSLLYLKEDNKEAALAMLQQMEPSPRVEELLEKL